MRNEAYQTHRGISRHRSGRPVIYSDALCLEGLRLFNSGVPWIEAAERIGIPHRALRERVYDRGWHRLTGGTRPREDMAAERFWAKVVRDPETECWIWNGSLYGNGYGGLRVEKRMVKAHRFAYELLVGPIPDGLTIDHLCRVRACVNPAHLEPVTLAENSRRGRDPRFNPSVATAARSERGGHARSDD